MEPKDTEGKRPSQKAFRLGDDTRALLAALSRRMDINETAVVTLAIRQMAQREGVTTEASKEAHA